MRYTKFAVVWLMAGMLVCLSGFEMPSFADDSPRIPDDATARTLDGKTVSIADHRGKLVFLNIWKTDCIACLHEIPILNRVQKEYASANFTIVGLAMDKKKDERVAQVMKVGNIAYPVWLGDGQPIAKYADVWAYPFLLAIGPNGELIGYIEGAFPTYEHAVDAIKRARELLEKKESSK
ncbi:MAG: TlpA family protein disulfide reductase [Candidatus Abyssobacteria bacterium SURF_17]|uniref:TlpA family protein disulfide reductase n=1 Tax=Candidatus Abyssobacteria bacterium SURF_17 TaxID=2093361 RepID=A0A419EZJ2_9BACT|nr:MAG: TlpA family protein disulfide reductase [Candidatus Abyssubacteria bacterium SURF_17]